MQKNVSGIDRGIRIVLGIGLIAATLTGSVGAWGWIGVVPLATGLVGFCPIYRICGCNRCASR